jgi:hypothetical protein
MQESHCQQLSKLDTIPLGGSGFFQGAYSKALPVF